MTTIETLDVRDLIPMMRHKKIFQVFDSLNAGEAFILVNDHDPKPLYYQFLHERPEQFSWDTLEEGPQNWRVRIGRVAASWPQIMTRLVRLPMLLVVLLLTGGLYGGLIRLGWGLPVVQPQLAGWHGAIMVAGVFGTVIAMERAVALRTNSRSALAYAAFLPPLCSAAGAALLFTPAVDTGKLLIVLNGLGLVIVYTVVIHRQPTAFALVMGAGGYMLLIGNALWATGKPIYSLVYWWMGFLILTIVGERLELVRVMRPSRLRQPAFHASVLVFIAGVALTYADADAGARLAGVGELALAAWLLHYDIARFTIRRRGLPRFIAVCLLSGYAWLGVGGLLSLIYGGVAGGFQYDAVLHAVLLGFVFSMIFGHAPIIIPAVVKLAVPFSSWFYLHLVVLHGGLVVRVSSDIAGYWAGREWGGLINVTAVVLFLAAILLAVRRGLLSKSFDARPDVYSKRTYRHQFEATPYQDQPLKLREP